MGAERGPAVWVVAVFKEALLALKGLKVVWEAEAAFVPGSWVAREEGDAYVAMLFSYGRGLVNVNAMRDVSSRF